MGFCSILCRNTSLTLLPICLFQLHQWSPRFIVWFSSVSSPCYLALLEIALLQETNTICVQLTIIVQIIDTEIYYTEWSPSEVKVARALFNEKQKYLECGTPRAHSSTSAQLNPLTNTFNRKPSSVMRPLSSSLMWMSHGSTPLTITTLSHSSFETSQFMLL